MTDAPVDPEGFERRLSQYAEWLTVNHFSDATGEMHLKCLRRVVGWCADRGITRPSEVTKPVLERFQAHLFHYRKANGEPLMLTSQRNFLSSIRGFFRWLARQNHILYNPASELLLPRLGRRLPKAVLTPAETERVLAVPDLSTPLGLRDRAILETVYSCGLRRKEIVALKLYDIDRDRGTVMVREGKGRAQRVIPIGARALKWVDKYLDEARPQLVVPPDDGYVFVTRFGKGFNINSLTGLVHAYVDQAEVGKEGAVHLFRHTMATAMIEGGADARFVQEMLGHSKLTTTALYTHVSIKKLKEVHSATHPAERRRVAKKSLRKTKSPSQTPGPETELGHP